MKDLVGNPDIILVLPKDLAFISPSAVKGYSVHVLEPSLDGWWIEIHRKAIPSFSEGQLSEWLSQYRKLALEDGILVATSDISGEPVATAGSLSNSKGGMFPSGGQLGWVATVPDHQGRGLASWLSGLATKRLQADGFELIFLCTGDEMLAAIGVYLKLGYLPYLYASDQERRWKTICARLNIHFAPDKWFKPIEGVPG